MNYAEWISNLMVGVFLVLEGLVDLRKKIVSVKILVLFGIIGMICMLFCPTVSLLSICAGVGLGGLLLLISKCSLQRIGYGDGFVLMVIGLFWGIRETTGVFFLGLLLSALFSIGLLMFHKANRQTRIPFIPFLFGGYLLMMTTRLAR